MPPDPQISQVKPDLNRRALDPGIAGRIYDVLHEECGARSDERQQFVDYSTSHGLTEYRFCGSLGFGGKVWDAGPFSCYRPRFRVSCYQEDETPVRLESIRRANARLKEIHAGMPLPIDERKASRG